MLSGEARADSVHVLDENLNAHLLSPDFFDAEQAPVLSFVSTEIRRAGSDLAVAGELTIKGVTAPVELDGTIGEVVSASVRRRAPPAPARGHDRSPRVRHRLEHGAPERRAGARERRDARRRALPGQGVDDEGPRHHRQPAQRLPQHAPCCARRRGLLPDDVELELWDGLRAVPPYDEDDDVEPAPAAVADLRDAIAGADAILFATPEYNHSVPGQLKNALDWASRPLATNPLRNKPVAVVGASTGAFGAVWAQAELRKVLAATGARVVDGEVAVGHAHERFDADGAPRRTRRCASSSPRSSTRSSPSTRARELVAA